MCDFVKETFEMQDIKQEHRRHMDRNKYNTIEYAERYFEKGRNSYVKGEYKTAKSWLKKALYIFQELCNKESFVDVLRLMENVIDKMGGGKEYNEICDLTLRCDRMTPDEFAENCRAGILQQYGERPTFNDTQKNALICDLLKDLQRAA